MHAGNIWVLDDGRCAFLDFDIMGELLPAFSPKELLLVAKQLAYIERYALGLAPDYAIVKDLYLVKNIFPEEVARLIADRGIVLPEEPPWVGGKLAVVFLVLIAVLVLLFVVLPLVGMALWAFLTTIVVGLIIGALGRLVIPGTQPIGVLSTVICGLSGSIVGGFLGQHVFGVGGFATVLLEIAVAAMTVLVVSRAGKRRLPSS